MKDLLRDCMIATGYDQKTVEQVVSCFLELLCREAGNVTETGRRDLLEELHARVGCCYLSDLHLPHYLPLVQRAIEEIVPGDYSLSQWNDAAAYISQKNVSFDTPEEAARHLLALPAKGF